MRGREGPRAENDEKQRGGKNEKDRERNEMGKARGWEGKGAGQNKAEGGNEGARTREG